MGQSVSILQLVQQGSTENLETALQNQKSDLSAVDTEGRNALHWASIQGQKPVVELLLQHSPDLLQSLDDRSYTPLHMAAFSNQATILTLLLDKGALIDAQDETGMTPLHWAVTEHHADCVSLLLARGADRAINNNKGKSPYELAQGLKKRFINQILPLFEGTDPQPQPDAPPKDPSTPANPTPEPPKAEPKKAEPQKPARVITQLHQDLACVCKIWGRLKYKHPFLAYRSDIDWDNQLLIIVNKLLELDENTTRERFVDCVARMLEQLKDPNTTVKSKVIPTGTPTPDTRDRKSVV